MNFRELRPPARDHASDALVLVSGLRGKMRELADRMEAHPTAWSDEKDVQLHLLEVLGDGWTDEHRSPAGRYDLWHEEDGIVVEVKVKGSPAAVMRQILGYASEPEVRGVILATTRSTTWRLGLDVVSEKPLVAARLWRWGLL